MIINESKFNLYWQTKQLSELGLFRRGKSRHRPRNDPKLFENGSFPLVQTGEVKEANLFIRKHNASYNDFGLAQSQIWPENTLCITIAANIAETSLLGYPMCFPDSVVGFNAYSEESSELFMHYVFTYIRGAIQNSASGSIQDNINIEYLTGLKFKIPKKDYQDKIASVLSTLDKKIELNNRINAELEAMAKTLYDYWFVQFDFPDANGKPYKTSGGKMVYNPTLKREIPEGWNDMLIEDCAVLFRGVTYGKEDVLTNCKSAIGVLRATNITGHQLDIDELVYVPDELVSENQILKKFETLIVMSSGSTEHIGKNGIYYFDDKYAFGAFCSKLQIQKEFTNYLNTFLNSVWFKTYIKNQCLGTNINNLTNEHIKKCLLIKPDNVTLKQFDTHTKPFYEKIAVNYQENLQFKNLRDWLLPMLMNGQVTVR
jgi:type I restriction enzyme S subunit